MQEKDARSRYSPNKSNPRSTAFMAPRPWRLLSSMRWRINLCVYALQKEMAKAGAFVNVW